MTLACFGDVLARALGRVGQIEKDPARPGHQRHHLFQQLLENPRHTGEHRPIDQRDEGGVVKDFHQTFERDVLKEVFPIHFAQAEVLAEHQLPIVELDRIRVTRFRQRNHFGARREIREDRMDIRRPEEADIGHRRAVGVERVGHDRTVPAQFDHLLDHLEIRAQPRRVADFFPELGHAAHAGVTLRALPRGHHVQDGVHKAVQADEAAGLREGVRA